MRTFSRALTFSALCVLALSGCASHPQRAQPAKNPGPPPSRAAQPAQANPTGTAPDEELPPAPDGMIGVASCDQYLSTYKACHRAAGIFAPGQLEARYQSMRNGLLRDARDPVKRAALDQRCQALARQLQDALHGKSCNAAPGSSSSSG